MTRVLVVEDEESFAEALAHLLRSEGFDVMVTGDGTQALRLLETLGADLVLLDLMLPGMSGTDVCRAIRRRSSLPIIIVSAKDSEVDKVVGLELGADDYVTKPFSSRELLARIHAVMRRDSGDRQSDSPSVIDVGPVRIDTDRHAVWIRGEQVDLALKEFDLLTILTANAGRVLTRGQLMDRVWGSDYVGSSKTLDVHVKRLRTHIERDPAEPEHLITVRKLGYKFEP